MLVSSWISFDRRASTRYLNDNGSSDDIIVSNSLIAAGEYNVALACNRCSASRGFWDREGEAAIDSGSPARQSIINHGILLIVDSLSENRSRDCDKSSIKRARTIRRFKRVTWSQRSKNSASGDPVWVLGRSLQRRKSLDR